MRGGRCAPALLGCPLRGSGTPQIGRPTGLLPSTPERRHNWGGVGAAGAGAQRARAAEAVVGVLGGFPRAPVRGSPTRPARARRRRGSSARRAGRRSARNPCIARQSRPRAHAAKPRPEPPRGRARTRSGPAASAPRAPAPTRNSSRRSCRRSRPGPGHSVLVERAELPVGRAEAGGAVEGQVGQLGQAEDVRQVVVGFVLPAGGPDQLVVLEEPLQPLAGERARCSAPIPSTSSNRATSSSGGSSKPNSEMTPSTSTARIGRLTTPR